MKDRCNFTKCCICLYGNECMPTWNLPYEFTTAPRALIIQRLMNNQFCEYRNYMISALKKLYNYDFTEINSSESILKKYDLISEDIDLEKCPFCDGPAELYITKHVPNGYDFTPRCKQTMCCGRLTKKYSSRKVAIQCWNLRVPMDQIKTNFRQTFSELRSEIQSMRNLSEAGIHMIDTDSIFFSSYDSAVKYANRDPRILFSKYSMPGQIILVREDDAHIGKYIIENDRSLRKIEDDKPNNESNVYTKNEIDNLIKG